MQVLVATDGSKFGKWALEWVARLPLAEPPSVKVIHILDLGALRAPFMVQPVVAGTERYLKAEVAKFLKQAKRTKAEAAALLKSFRLKGRVVTERGPIAATIVESAKRGVQLVAIGSRGLDAIDRFMLGSVSTHVVHHVSCSVLVVREAPPPLRSVLLAVDGSAASKRAVQFLLRTMTPMPASRERAPEPLSVTVVHAMPFLNYPGSRPGGSVFPKTARGRVPRRPSIDDRKSGRRDPQSRRDARRRFDRHRCERAGCRRAVSPRQRVDEGCPACPLFRPGREMKPPTNKSRVGLMVLLCFCVLFQMLGVPAPLLDAGGAFDVGESSIQEGWSIQSTHVELPRSSCYVLIDHSHRSMCVPILAGALFRPPLS